MKQGVFTYLLTSLGVRNVQFEELVSLDPISLASINALGVIFLFKYPTGEKPSDTPKDGKFDFEAVEKSYTGEGGVWFASQMIQNACGTQALLGMLMNKAVTEGEGGDDGQKVVLGKSLEEFREFTMGFPADVRPTYYTSSKDDRL